MSDDLKFHPGDEPATTLADYVRCRLPAAAGAYWTALQPNLGVPWHDCYSKPLGMLCELLAERDTLVEDIEGSSDSITGLMEGQNNELRKHPLYTRLNQVETQAHDIMHRFGMNPAGMKKLKGTQDGAKRTLGSLIG